MVRENEFFDPSRTHTCRDCGNKSVWPYLLDTPGSDCNRCDRRLANQKIRDIEALANAKIRDCNRLMVNIQTVSQNTMNRIAERRIRELKAEIEVDENKRRFDVSVVRLTITRKWGRWES